MWKLYYGKDRENYERIIIAENAEAASRFAHTSKWVDKYPVCIGLADEYDVELKCEGVEASVLMVTKGITGDGIFAVEKYAGWIEARGKYPNRRCGTCKYLCVTFANEPCIHCRAAAEWLPQVTHEAPKSGRYPWGTGKKQEAKTEEQGCGTCKYKNCDVFGPECKPCKYVDGHMTNWTPVDNKKEEKKDKPLSEYTVEELEVELRKRREEQIEEARKKAADEARKWLESFIIGDYYKISLKDSKSDRFVIVRAEKLVKLDHEDIGHLSCVNVYDHGMGWIRQPAIGSFFKTGTKYVVEHIVEGMGRVAM